MLMRWLCVLVSSISFLAFFCFSSEAQAMTGAHDPVIMKQGEWYYLFATSRGLAIQRSQDLVNWLMVGRVFSTSPKWAKEQVPKFDGNIWAPDISYVNGKYYLYYSISSFGSNLSRIGLAVNATLDPNDPAYKWEDRGPVIKSETYSNYNAIDPNLIQDADGRSWLSFGSFWSGIKLVEVDPATGAPFSDMPALTSLASRPGVQYNPIEAPFIFRRGDYYYLFVSWDFCCKGVNSTYKMAVGRAEKVTGPYVDKDGKDLLHGGGTILLQGDQDFPGVGHNAVYQDGEIDWLVYHAYSKKRGGMAILQIRPLTWDADGWPAAGEPLE